MNNGYNTTYSPSTSMIPSIIFISSLPSLSSHCLTIKSDLRASHLLSYGRTYHNVHVRSLSFLVILLFRRVLCLLECRLLTRSVYLSWFLPEILLEIAIVELNQLEENLASKCKDFVLMPDKSWQKFLFLIKSIFPKRVSQLYVLIEFTHKVVYRLKFLQNFKINLN